MTEPRPPWSRRRRRLLLGLGAVAALGGAGALLLPTEFGVTAAYVGALSAFLLVAATVVFVTVPGPDTAGTLLRSTPVAGAVLVVGVLVSLSAEDTPLWWLTAAVGAVWLAAALWLARTG